MKPTRVLILAGGQSDEHEVSMISARCVLAALRDTPLQAEALVISRTGHWLSAQQSSEALAAGKAPSGGDTVLQSAQIAERFDVVFPLLHGPFGEDGTVQGMLELAGIPYVGSGVLASAVCMDKVMTKDVLASHNIPQVRYCMLTAEAHKHASATLFQQALRLKAPWFVKPANLGSSIGISKATDEASLKKAVATAFDFDRRVIIEEGVPGARELEVGILGNANPAASPVGEITYQADFYDYATKYTDGRSAMHIPANIPSPIAAQIQDFARRAYTLLDCAGLARVDFFYQPDKGAVLLNEINTLPGFTPLSMFPKLWEAGGLRYAHLIERLVALALDRHRPA